ncbi:MAG: BatD family protein, partial [Chthoniobacteraceae bacterium]
DRIMQMQIPGNPPPPPPTPPEVLRRRPALREQLGRLPVADPSKLSATAAFVPGAIRMKDFGEYHVTITGARTGIEMPDRLPAPEGVVVKDTGQRTFSTKVVNGERIESVTFLYSVAGVKPGTFVLPSFTAQISGLSVTVPAAAMVVREPQPGERLYENARAVLDLKPGEYFVGQTINTRLLIIDSEDEIAQAIANVSKPSGDFLFRSQLGARREVFSYEGKAATGLTTPIQFTPIKPGTSDVSLEAICFINRSNNPRAPGVRRPPGVMSGYTQQSILTTEPVRIVVRPLPEAGRRPGFTGAIGKFELSHPQLSSDTVRVGDPLTVTIGITGDGNLEGISAPPIEGGDEWRSFSPTSEIERDALTGHGTKTFTYTLIARDASTRAVPSIPFSYFDPEKKEYVNLTVPPVPVTVTPAAETESAASADPAPIPPPGAPDSEDAKTAGAKRILTGLAEVRGPWRHDPSPVSSRAWFWILQAVPALVLMSLWIWRRRQNYLETHLDFVRRRHARKSARRHLRRARFAVRDRDPETFIAAGIDAIREAAAPLDSARAESIVLEEVIAKLDPAEREGEAGRTVRRFFETAHTARFSGHTPEPNGVLELFPSLEGVVTTLIHRK